MRFGLRGGGPWALGASVLRLGLIGLATLPLAAAGGCGRIGYDPLPEQPFSRDGAPHGPDATQSGEGGGSDQASEAPTAEAGGDTTLGDGTPGLDATGDESLDANLDASADGQCTVRAAVDYCQVIPPLPAPPVIDGVLDCGPTPVAIVPEGWRGAAPLPPFPSGNTSTVAAAWRPDGLYIFMAITTPIAIPAELSDQDYKGAGVEIFVDDNGVFTTPGQYDVPGTVQEIVTSPPIAPPDGSAPVCPSDASADAQPEASSDGASEASSGATDGATDAPPEAATTWTGPRAAAYRNETLLGPWTSTRFGTFPTATGFVFEGFVTAADLGLTTWSLAAGSTVGFDVAVDVSFPDYCTVGLEGHRAGQYFLHVGTNPADADAAPIGAPFADSRSFCTPTLTP